MKLMQAENEIANLKVEIREKEGEIEDMRADL